MATMKPGSLEGDVPRSAEAMALDEATRPARDATTAAERSMTLARALTAENTIKTYVTASVAASIVPVPLFDIAAIFAIQLRMIQKLSQLYGQPFSESIGRSVIASLAGGVLGYGVGATVGLSLAKIIPGIGWMVGMLSLPVVAGASTYAIGHVFMKHFEEGGSMFDMSTNMMRAYYREQFEKGKRLAEMARADLRERGTVRPDERPVA